MKSAKRTSAALSAAFALFCISLWAGGGCSPSEKARPGTQARWERKLGWPATSVAPTDVDPAVANLRKLSRRDRRVADAAPRCLKDRVTNAEFLRQEVTRLEHARGGTPVTGTWQGKDLSTFPPTQAQFLSANADWIATDGIDFSSCNDLPCILNQVYGNGASGQGWKVYYFYLAMGYSLSCRDYVPSSLGPWSGMPGRLKFSAPLAGHLFSDRELYSFWKLSYLLPDAYRFMGSQRFHRIPDGDEYPGGWDVSTCADSVGTKTSGIIRAKRCLDEDNFARHEIYFGDDGTLPDNGIRGQFYVVMTHEMTHTWDRTQSTGAVDGLLTEFSDSDEWKNLSGWHQETIVAPAADGSGPGVSRSAWTPSSEGDGFVRDYARASPHEDLAETAAWVRLRPTLVTQRSPRKAAFLSRKLYGGRTYDDAGLAAYYTDTTVNGLTPAKLLDLVNGCLMAQAPPSSGSAGVAIVGSVHLTLDHPLPEMVVACLENELNNRITAALDELRGTEWEACDLLATQETKIRSDVFNRVSADVSRIVGQNLERAPIIRATRQLEAALALQVDPREAYVHCFRQAQPESCYQQAMSDAFDHTAQSSDNGGPAFALELGEGLAQEKTSFLALNPFLQSQTRASQFYQLVFAGVEPAVTAVADARWQDCLTPASAPAPATPAAAGDSAPIPLVSPFSGGAHFVSSDILNCINSAYDADLRKVRDAFISRLGLSVSDPDVQALIQGILLPGYLDALRAKEEAAASAEDADRTRRKQGVLDVLDTQLTRDLSWLAGATTSDVAASQCAVAAAAAFNDYFSHVSPAEQLPTRFAAIGDIRTSWSHDACVRVIAGPSVTQVLNQRAEEAWTAAMTVLESAVASRARDTATDCIARNPNGALRVSRLVKNHRHQCLTSAQNWSMIEAQALVDWAQTVEGHAIAVSRHADAMTYLSGHRHTLQTAALSAMDAR